MSDPSPSNPTSPSKPISPAKKLGIGLTVVALPIAAAVGVWQFKQAEDANNEDLESGFKYDMAALSKVDPALIGYREVGVIPTQMQSPTCMAISKDGKILVGAANLVKVLDARGQELLSFPVSSSATAIASSPTGDVYVGLKDRVAVYAATGELKATWPTLGPTAHITCIAVSDTAAYVADAGGRVGRAMVFALDGTLKGQIAKADAAKQIPGISTPSPHMDLAIAADGKIWVANPGHHQLELYSPAGELLRSFGSSGTGIEQFLGCCNPSDFALLSDGRIVTAEKGVARIKVYKDDGHFQSVVAPPSAFGDNRAGLDVATDSSGRVLVLEPGTSSIRIFAENHP